jgi:hypothetical protein
MQDNWDLWLPYIAFVMRTRKIRYAPGMVASPFYLTYGYDNPIMTDFDKALGDHELTDVQDVKQRLGHVMRLVELVKPELVRKLSEQAAMREYHPAERVVFNPGQVVQVRRGERKKKSDPLYKPGLYKIVEKTELGNYRLEPIVGRALRTPVHPSDLCPIPPSAVPRIIAKGLVDEIDEATPTPQGEWEVERIVAHKRFAGQLLFQVKWKNTDEITWEPRAHLTRCGRLLKQYIRDNLAGEAEVATLVVSEPRAPTIPIGAAIASAKLDRAIHSHWSEVANFAAAVAQGRPSAGRIAPDLMPFLRSRFRRLVPQVTDNRFSGQIDLDLFARDWTFPLANQGLTDFFRDAERFCKRQSITTLWVNPPWTFYLWLGEWLQYHAAGKLLLVVVPKFRGYHSHIANWNVDWRLSIPLPDTVPNWFTHGNGTVRPKPSWPCHIWVGVQRPLAD